MKFLQTFVMIGIGMGIVACASSKKTEQIISLSGDWNIVSVGDKMLEFGPPYISFWGDNRISGNAGCNRIMGNYEADTLKSILQFGELATTRMMCPHMETENLVLGAMAEVKSYKAKEENEKCILELMNEQGKVVMVIEKR